jgi:hypothetical protein
MKTDKEIKAEVLAKVKPILKKKGLKGTLAFPDGRTMRLTLKVNEETAKWIYEGSVYSYHAHDYKWEETYLFRYKDDVIHCLTGDNRVNALNKEAGQFLADIGFALNYGNWDNSDVQTDYFDFGWLSEIKVIIV